MEVYMKTKLILIIIIGTILIPYVFTDSQDEIDEFLNTRPLLQSTITGVILPGSTVFTNDPLVNRPVFNPDGSITLFSNKNFRIRIMPMTDGRTRSALNRTTDEFDTMIANYEEILLSNPNDYEACIMLAGLHIDRSRPGDAEKAIEYSDRALAISHNDPQALYARGIAHSERGDSEKALSDLTGVLRANIQSMKGVYYIMGMIHYKEGNLNEALDAFEAVRAIDPDFADIEEILGELRKLID
jgi:cytochrome c-type biogenesis protein CcmH/NrfG